MGSRPCVMTDGASASTGNAPSSHHWWVLWAWLAVAAWLWCLLSLISTALANSASDFACNVNGEPCDGVGTAAWLLVLGFVALAIVLTVAAVKVYYHEIPYDRTDRKPRSEHRWWW